MPEEISDQTNQAFVAPAEAGAQTCMARVHRAGRPGSRPTPTTVRNKFAAAVFDASITEQNDSAGGR
jgi:hypothetical protein